MKTLNAAILWLTRVMALAGALAGRAQSYTLDWSSIDAGASESSGGSYSLASTTGLPEAGLLSGGAYTVQGSFWGVETPAQSPGAPALSIWQLGSVMRIVWAKPADGWMLESTASLAGAGPVWTPVAQTYQDDGLNLYVTFNAPAGTSFFRLRRN